MIININCIYNDQGAWCKNTEIPRSFFGLGARCCIEFDKNKKCNIKTEYCKPSPTAFKSSTRI